MFSKVSVTEGQLALYMVKRRLGNTDSTGIGESFQPGGDVHSVAVNPGFLLDHVAKVDPNTKLHSPVLGHLGVAGLELFLCRYSALHRVHHAGELSQKIVPRRVDYPASVLSDEIEEGLLVGFDGG